MSRACEEGRQSRERESARRACAERERGKLWRERDERVIGWVRTEPRESRRHARGDRWVVLVRILELLSGGDLRWVHGYVVEVSQGGERLGREEVSGRRAGRDDGGQVQGREVWEDDAVSAAVRVEPCGQEAGFVQVERAEGCEADDIVNLDAGRGEKGAAAEPTNLARSATLSARASRRCSATARASSDNGSRHVWRPASNPVVQPSSRARPPRHRQSRTARFRRPKRHESAWLDLRSSGRRPSLPRRTCMRRRGEGGG